MTWEIFSINTSFIRHSLWISDGRICHFVEETLVPARRGGGSGRGGGAGAGPGEDGTEEIRDGTEEIRDGMKEKGAKAGEGDDGERTKV